MSRPHRDRAATPVVATDLLLAVTVLLAASVGVTAFTMRHPGGHLHGRRCGPPLAAYVPGDGDREQLLRLVHEAGASVPAEQLELRVRVVHTGVEARVTGLPAEANKLDADDVASAGFLDRSHGETVGSLSATTPDTDGRWGAGDTLGVRIVSGDVRLAPGDEVVLIVVHVPSGGVLTAVRLRAR